MADNLTTTTTVSTIPASTVIATDDAGAGGHVQIVKLAIGTDGSATPLTADNTNGLLVNLGSNNDVTLATLPDTAAADLAAINTAVNGTLTVNGSGVTQPVSNAALTTADLDTGVGTDTRGVTGIALAESGGAVVVGSANPLPVDGSGVTQPVSGTVTANLSAVDNAVLDSIDTAVNGTLTVSNANIDNLHSADFDTGAGADTTPAIGIAVPASGGAAVITGDATNGLDVDVTRVSGTVTVDGSGVTQPVSAASLPLPTGAATTANQTTIIGHVDGIEGLLTTIDADTGTLSGAVSGTEMQVDVVAALPAGTNTIGAVNVKPATSGGLTIFRSLDLDETEEEVKATAGQLYGWYLFNASAGTRYIKFYNATAATVIVGTTVPVLTIPVPAGSAANVEYTNGIAFSTAITVAATTGVADADTGAPSANDVIVNIFYA